uniref:hypothetical protein n=1 Tax=Clostridium sp. TaxID=1506 RepID=UPI0026193AEE
MLVNNINISMFKAILLYKDIQSAEIIIYEDWLKNSANPTYMYKEEKYKKIKIKILIEDSTDEEALNDISNLVKQITKCSVKFDDLIYNYECLIVNKNHERISMGYYILEIELKSGHAYKNEVKETMNRITSKTINVGGNTTTPTVVEITPFISLVDLTL